MPKTTSELRAFLMGALFGVACVIGTLHAVSYTAGIKWQPVKIEGQ